MSLLIMVADVVVNQEPGVGGVAPCEDSLPGLVAVATQDRLGGVLTGFVELLLRRADGFSSDRRHELRSERDRHSSAQSGGQASAIPVQGRPDERVVPRELFVDL